MPSQAEIEQYQQDVEELSALAVAEIAAVVVALSGEDDETLVSAIPPAMEPYMAAAANLATAWYRSLAREEPRKPKRQKDAPEPMSGPTGRVALLDAADFEPRPAALPPREQIEATVWWALAAEREPEPDTPAEDLEPEEMSREELETEVRRLREPEPTSEPVVEPVDLDEPEDEGGLRARMVPAEEVQARVTPAEEDQPRARVIERLSGATQRYVTTAARDTITENAEREGVRWARHAQPDACAFCRLLATRGPDYLTKESAKRVVGRNGLTRGKRKIGELYHDDCGCEPVPVRAGDSYEPPAYVARWNTQYSDAYDEGDGDFKSILRAMRQAEKERGGSRH
ncbi:hypothetical protein [Nocardia asiatica]|uniref:VG15 protein n=1 Tax=Nocardia asiatica TaxID=209252 RepID=UPI002455D3EB|nr:hypothetical protein [Nocardia asiatica]